MKKFTAKKIRLLLWSILSSFLLCANVQAQSNREISGTVTSDGNPVEGATILVKGTP